jgi:hypothetical protein
MDHSSKDIQSFASGILSLIEKILEQINKLLSVLSKSNNIFSSKISSITSRNRCLRQLVRETLLMLQDDLLNACESLADFGTNKEIYKEIRGEIPCKETRQLKIFLDVCTKRLNRTKDSYDKFCNVTKRLCVEIDQAKRECEKLLEEKKTTHSRSGLGVGAAGLAAVGGAVVLALSPIAAPALGLVALGAGGVSGVLAGIYRFNSNPDDDDIKTVIGAHAELERLNSIIQNIHLCANKCAYKIRGSAQELEPTIDLSEQSNEYQGNLLIVDIPECFGLDSNQLQAVTESEAIVNAILDKFEKHMKSLLAGTKEARAKTETCIKKFQEPD